MRTWRRLSVVLTVVAVAAMATPAGAAVTLSPRTVTVTAPSGARAVVTRSPFGIAFLDPHGQRVLTEAPARTSLAVLPPVPQNEFGEISPAPPTLYGPLSFVVGTQSVQQSPGGNWVGNLQSVTRTGVGYRAASVLSAKRSGRGVRLVLSTTDPTGRRLDVQLVPGRDSQLRVAAQADPALGVAALGDSFTTGPDEAFHGFGGRHNSLDERGSQFYDWLQQENVSSGSATGLTTPTDGATYMFPNGPEAAYDVGSDFVSSRGYGFLLDTTALSDWRLASDSGAVWQTEASSPSVAYDVFADGRLAGAVSEVDAVAGRQPVPPAWSLGSLFDRETQYPSDPEPTYVTQVESDITAFKRYRIHVDGYRIEAWQFLPPAVLKHILMQLRALRIHPLVYFRPFVDGGTSGLDDPAQYSYAVGHGYVATDAAGQPYTFVDNYNQTAAMVDFTNPAAVRWWQARIIAALNEGADGFMQDFGEQVLTGMHFHDGESGATMHNRYPLLYDRATRAALRAFRRAHPKRHVFFYTRSGYTGMRGDAAYENANFPGDETTDWTRASGLASLASDMLNRAIGGQFGYTTDIGGYWDLGPFSPTTKELLIRWAEWAALTPFFRLHGSVFAGTHTPWSYDAQTVSIYRSLVALHRALRPLILSAWRQGDRTGIPVTRPLWLAYPSDPVAAHQDQEWLLGRNLLAAPVTTPGAVSQRAYLPAGCWRFQARGRSLRGHRYATVPAPLATPVYFVRCGYGRYGQPLATRRRARR